MAAAKSDKVSMYDAVTASIIAKLEKGASPWSPCWKSAAVSRPLRSVGVPYQGVNVLILWATAIDRGYTSPYWFTFQQAKELGASVKPRPEGVEPGEWGTRVVYFSTFDKSDTNNAGEDVTKKIPFLRSYVVFNAEQIDGLPAKFYPAADFVALDPAERIESVEELARAAGAVVLEKGGRACYSPLTDSITMPLFSSFDSGVAFASVLAHELVHWTASRVGRDLSKRFGDASYAMEELVAEMGAAFLLADLGIAAEPRDDHASYIASWLKILRQDSRAVFGAASLAGKAVEWLHEATGRRWAPSAGTVDEVEGAGV